MNDKPNTTKKIRRGDKVLVMSGNDRGQSGTVLRIIGEKAIVQGANIRKKHVKPSQQNEKGGIVEMEKPIHLSNLTVCTEDNRPVKLRVRQNKDGQRELYYKLDGEEVLYRSLKKQNN
jgi:large subunit ribosomal protein L24